MKNNYILLAFLFSSFFSISQTLTVNNSANIIDPDGNKWTVTEVRDILYSNPKALELYNIGREKKTWGNVLLYGGLAAVATNVILNATTGPPMYSGSPYYSAPKSKATFAPAIIGAAMIIIAIPVKIGHTKKVKTAIEMYNASLNNNSSTSETTMIFTASSNQVGFKVNF